MIRTVNELTASAETFDDTEELAVGLDALAEDAGIPQDKKYWFRECAIHMRRMHELLAETVRALKVRDRSSPGPAPQNESEVLPAHGDSLLRLPDVERMTGLKKSAIYAGMKNGTFPQCVKIGARAAAWPAQEIRDWSLNMMKRHRGVGRGPNTKSQSLPPNLKSPLLATLYNPSKGCI